MGADDDDAAIAALRETSRTFEEQVIAGRDWAALAQVYTPDARILPPGAPMVEGLAGITEFWRQAVGAMGITGGQLHTADLQVAGPDSAWEVGRADLMLAGAIGPVEVKYVVLWRRQDGAWKWHVHIWNTSAG
jgi:uncharacterized protein (TIGR02246 family)